MRRLPPQAPAADDAGVGFDREGAAAARPDQWPAGVARGCDTRSFANGLVIERLAESRRKADYLFGKLETHLQIVKPSNVQNSFVLHSAHDDTWMYSKLGRKGNHIGASMLQPSEIF